MNRVAGQLNTQFVLSAGDNFYTYGVTDVSDSRFEDTFENVYNGDNIDDHDWFVVPGNHGTVEQILLQ